MINIQRDTSNPPACLAVEKQKELSGAKKDGDYRCGDVVSRVKADFFNKCYICEVSKPTSINIEHFRPHRDKNIDLKFDYSNLFFACAHCNNCKSDGFENLLNCTDPNEDVENWIEYRIEPIEGSKAELNVVDQANPYWDKAKIEETIKLLEKIYNGDHTSIKTEESDSLRILLVDEMWDFTQRARRYFSNKYCSKEQKDAHESIRLDLRSDSNFTAFKRWIIKRNSKLNAEFQAFLQ